MINTREKGIICRLRTETWKEPYATSNIRKRIYSLNLILWKGNMINILLNWRMKGLINNSYRQTNMHFRSRTQSTHKQTQLHNFQKQFLILRVRQRNSLSQSLIWRERTQFLRVRQSNSLLLSLLFSNKSKSSNMLFSFWQLLSLQCSVFIASLKEAILLPHHSRLHNKIKSFIHL